MAPLLFPFSVSVKEQNEGKGNVLTGSAKGSDFSKFHVNSEL